ncbi:MAG: LysR family transcriptional regulator [Deltaproteobacteria bacterium]|nr:MAG: LysR family transcriptional regulator [Deltaproteobacteria bacterium]
MPRPGRLEEMAWSDLQVVLAICRTGSLSGAARRLGCNHSTVYRRIGQIEESVGVRFFERLPGGYEMTEAGQLALRFGERVEAEFDALHREVLGLDGELRGHVVVTAMEVMAATLLPQLLTRFRMQHPGVTVEAVSGFEYLNLRRRQADVAIRATSSPPGDMLGKRICDFRFGLYATREYLERAGERPVNEHDFVALNGVIGWLVPAVFPTEAEAEAHIVFRTNNSATAIAACRAGAGLMPMSCYSCADMQDLVRVDFFPKDDFALWVLIHPDLRHTARVKAVRDFLVEELTARIPLFTGEAGSG